MSTLSVKALKAALAAIDAENQPRYVPFDKMTATMITFIATYIYSPESEPIGLEDLFRAIQWDPRAAGVYTDMPVFEDGTIVAKGYKSEREGAIRKSRRKEVFKNNISVDISALGGNVNYKVSSTNNLQGAGAKSIQQAMLSAQWLVYRLNCLSYMANRQIVLASFRVERCNYNFALGFKVNLAAVAKLLPEASQIPRLENLVLSVIYDNTVESDLRACKLSENWADIQNQRSKRSKRSKAPSCLLVIRTSGKIMLGGPDIQELAEIYTLFQEWVILKRSAIEIVSASTKKGKSKR